MSAESGHRADRASEERLAERGHVLHPPEYMERERNIIFLAGPVSGAPKWHREAIEIITAGSSDVIVANPNTDGLPAKVPHAERTDWEMHHLEAAAETGAVMFWLPNQVDPVDHYAKTTRLELGMWMERAQGSEIGIVIGIAEGFADESTIRRYLGHKCPHVPILTSLPDTCEAAIRVTTGSESG